MASPEEIAWAAGFFEGEGTITVSGNRLVARVSNTDDEVLKHYADVMAIGTVYGPYGTYPSGHRKKPLWVWAAQSYDALDAIALMWPWLGTRRRRRAEELSGVRFPVFCRASSELLAEREPGRPRAAAG